MREVSGSEWIALTAEELLQTIEEHYQAGFRAGLAAGVPA